MTDKDRLYDEYLVTAARAGDRDALGRLIRRFHPRLVRHAARLTGDAALADDIAQETWEQILHGLPGLDDARAFPAWAYRIASRRSARAVDRLVRQRRLNTELAQDEAARTVRPADAAPERREDFGAVMKIAATLSGPQRAALALFYLEDMSIVEISAALAIPEGTVKTRLMLARNRIRDALKGDDDV